MRLPGRGWKEFFVALKKEWTKDNVSDTAGALTFFAILAVFPFLLFLVSLASVVIDPAQAQTLIQQLGEVAPAQVTQILGDRIRQLAEDRSVGLLTVGAVGAIWASSGGVVALMKALNTVYDVEETRPFWKVRGIAILMTLGGAVFSILAALAAVATPVLAEKLGGPVGTVINLLRLPVAGVLMMVVWAVTYYLLPNTEQRFKFLTPGSIFGVMVWLITSWAFSLYVANFGSYDANYGPLGGVIVLLLWMWITSQVLLLGAEINAVIEHKSPEGKAPGERFVGDRVGAANPKSASRSEGKSGAVALVPEPPPTAPPRRGELQPPGLAAAVWAAGLSLGVLLLRRRST